ncbi:hypothetical protein, partial [Staphylococcus aureus]
MGLCANPSKQALGYDKINILIGSNFPREVTEAIKAQVDKFIHYTLDLFSDDQSFFVACQAILESAFFVNNSCVTD